MMKVEGECKDQTQREGEERDIESAHARWWCVCVRMSDGAEQGMLACSDTELGSKRRAEKRYGSRQRESARGSRQRGGARRAERAMARRPRTGGGAGGITNAHTWTCTELKGVGGGVYTDEKETRMKDAEGENAGEERDRAEGRQGGANVAKVARSEDGRGGGGRRGGGKEEEARRR